MLTRTLSTLVLWTLVIAALYFGGEWGGAALLILLAGAAQWEYYGLRKAAGVPVLPKTGVALGFVFLACFAALVYAPSDWLRGCTAVAFLGLPPLVLAFAAWVCVRAPLRRVFNSILETGFGFLYIPVCLGVYIGLFSFKGVSENGLWFALFVIVLAKFSDVGGLLVGKPFGYHKLAPKISPKKSWEGLAGSVVFCEGVALVAYYLPVWAPATRAHFNLAGFAPLWAWVVFAAFIAVVALVSDLVESIFKRIAGKKDSGNLIPGIGGALDLCDSLVFSGLAAAAWLSFW